MAGIIVGLLLIVLGVSALIGLSLMKFFFAAILIFVGIKMLMGKRRSGWNKSAQTVSNEDFINEVVIFGQLQKTVKSENFKGGTIVMVFGSGDVDLSQVKTTEKSINIEFVAVFGGGRLIIPKNWRVNSQGTAILGGYDSRISGGEGETTLNIKGVAILGSVEIIN